MKLLFSKQTNEEKETYLTLIEKDTGSRCLKRKGREIEIDLFAVRIDKIPREREIILPLDW